MNKATFSCFLLLLLGFARVSVAQTSVNKIKGSQANENTSSGFIDGISFTPEGILQNTGGSPVKNVKVATISETVKNNESRTTVSEPLKNNESRTTISEPSNSIIEKLTGIQFKYAMILGVNVESLKNLSLFGFIENWLGTHYHMGGTTKSGIDCSALTSSLLMAVYGFAVPRTAREQYHATHHIKKNDLKEGDLVFFNTRGGVSHVGLYLDNDYFVHASSSEGVTISSLNDHYYARRFICGGRVPD